MKKTFALKPLALSVAVAAASAASIAPATAQAGELSYNASVSNMYLWRGINVSNPSPVVSGGIDYGFDNGFYVGTWASSEGNFDGSSEYDLYGGWAGEFGGFGVDLGYAAYLYPYAGEDLLKNVSEDGSMITEYIVGLSYADFSATAYINTEGADVDNYKYLSLGYGIGDFGLNFGKTMSDVADKEYTHFGVSYSATDALSFTLSKASGDGAIGIVEGDLGATGAENVQLQVSYDLPI